MEVAAAIVVGCVGLVIAYFETRGLDGASPAAAEKRVRRLRTSLTIWNVQTVVLFILTAVLLIATPWIFGAILGFAALVSLATVLYLRRRLRTETGAP